ncbi:uncharacterized protein LOC141691867 [Apium graveolens]|uniref:uncharacterized protein LOC141691867 n=1 Tax=Apium graveolens TaxID=4045 RepID=UPI003D79D858
MARFQNLEEHLAYLNIEEEETGDFIFGDEVEEQVNRYELCLVGRFLTEKNINTRAMTTKLADMWKPMMGVNIKEIDPGGPWSFDNAMLAISKIPQGEEPLNVPLWSLEIWIQIHDLPKGFMSEAVGRQLGDFFGEFMEYDMKNNSSIWVEFMRIKVKLDVRKPLKRKKRILRNNGTDFTVTCKYERLGDFCFAYGSVMHTERFCQKNIDNRGEDVQKEWGGWLRAPSRRAAN